ncbi:penicillin-binding protein 1A [Croceicoccus naphthovorans]|uniref:Penicillin-binding protein n=2 Tax=Croceicoccus naphthovorans TaxID=1348774 RepID=A0A0G3XM10_9SPHN|nr:transglycosylase domain-containing protein [Croceicoccus naphthovorans]AKM11651.1 penicillin-binding protein [Croceicoccus naphthovorans]MBB3990915.1 penicillin-binding protein 1A [Croceicoccus naphthovorans]
MTVGSHFQTYLDRARGDLAFARGHLASRWRESRVFRWLLSLFALGVAFMIAAYYAIGAGLPSADRLLTYQPPLPTMVRGIDGEIVNSYARERRVQLRYVDFPVQMQNAFLSAEDKTFWTHGGVDFGGLAGAVVDYVSKIGSGQRAKGGSTITQQVAKNILVGDEYSITRKLKEMILARRIEGVLTKQQILELYLNEIPLGRQSFGVQAAARAYFDKDVKDLELHESAFLAILPKAPERYGRARYKDLAIARRNYVLDQMVKNDWATREEAEAAKAKPLGLVPRRSANYDPAGGYFVEEVRRRLLDRFGEKAEDGPNSVYAGGLWVRTSMDMELQKAARAALRAGLLRYHSGKGWTGPIAKINMDENWQTQLIVSNLAVDYEDWQVGVVTQRSGNSAKIGFADGEEHPLSNLPDSLKAGDVIVAAPKNKSEWVVRTVPQVSGGLVVENPRTGRVLAMQGGFDSRLGSFNRATQAERQPGSTIKPFVYATGLDQGMTPATLVEDGPFCVWQGAGLGEKCFRNFGNQRGAGQQTMRWGLEQSRNLMTIHIANDAGMENVTNTFRRVGIGDYDNYLSFALGAGDTTVAKMVNAYSALANLGRQYDQSVIDYVQDRNGKVIWRADKRRCNTCSAPQWDGKGMPRLTPAGKQVLDAGTAYQVVHMLEGVVTRGTAVRLRSLELPIFGKTGTTSGPTNAWFVGGSSDLVAGVYIGFDQPRNLGGWVQGGNTAGPIIKQLIEETKARWPTTPVRAPADIRMVRIDRRSGKRVFDGWPSDEWTPATIWEAFKPDTEPRRSLDRQTLEEKRMAAIAALRAASEERVTRTEGPRRIDDTFLEDQGGIY